MTASRSDAAYPERLTVRLPPALAGGLDALVAEGDFASQSQALRAGLARLLAAHGRLPSDEGLLAETLATDTECGLALAELTVDRRRESLPTYTTSQLRQGADRCESTWGATQVRVVPCPHDDGPTIALVPTDVDSEEATLVPATETLAAWRGDQP